MLGLIPKKFSFILNTSTRCFIVCFFSLLHFSASAQGEAAFAIQPIDAITEPLQENWQPVFGIGISPSGFLDNTLRLFATYRPQEYGEYKFAANKRFGNLSGWKGEAIYRGYLSLNDYSTNYRHIESNRLDNKVFIQVTLLGAKWNALYESSNELDIKSATRSSTGFGAGFSAGMQLKFGRVKQLFLEFAGGVQFTSFDISRQFTGKDGLLYERVPTKSSHVLIGHESILFSALNIGYYIPIRPKKPNR